MGSAKTVGIIRDTPDLSFDLESLDVSTEIEALLLGLDPTTTTAGQEFDFLNSKPMDILSPFLASQTLYNVVKGIAIPYLNLEQVNYRFGTRANATQRFTLRGDSVYYVQGSPYLEVYPGTGSATAFAFTNAPALPFTEGATETYAYNVCIYKADGTYKRLFRGTDYTDTAAGITITTAPGATDKIHVVYGSATAATYGAGVHQGTSVKPAAVRGKDIDVYVETGVGTNTLVRWNGVQSFDVTRRVTLDNDSEFGNAKFVATDYNTADVTGTVTLRPRDVADLLEKVRQTAGVANDGHTIGAFTSALLKVELRISDPATGARLKTLYIPDARFSPPPITGRANTKADATLNLKSETGQLSVFKGARP